MQQALIFFYFITFNKILQYISSKKLTPPQVYDILSLKDGDSHICYNLCPIQFGQPNGKTILTDKTTFDNTYNLRYNSAIVYFNVIEKSFHQIESKKFIHIFVGRSSAVLAQCLREPKSVGTTNTFTINPGFYRVGSSYCRRMDI